MGTIVNIFFFVLLICFLFLLFKKDKELLFWLFPILYVYVWCIISTIYLESDEIYISDLRIFSKFNYSSIKLIIYLVIFLIAIYVSYYSENGVLKLKRKKEKVAFSVSPVSAIIILVFSYSIVLFWIIDIFISGNAFTNANITRFNYWSSYSKIFFVKYLVYSVSPLCFILGMIVVSQSLRKLYKIASIVLVGLFFICSLLIGNQFSGLVGILIYFLLPILIIYYDKLTKKQRRNSLLAVVIVFVVVGYIKYSNLTGENEFSNRLFVLQGDLWFSTDLIVSKQGGNFEAIFDIINRFFFTDSPEMDYLMRLVMPSSQYLIFKKGNVALYSGFPAFEISIFGYYFSLFVIFLEGIVYGKFLKFINKKIQSHDMPVSLVSVYFLIQYNKVFTMCGYSYLFNTIPLLCLFFIFVYEMLKTYFSKKSKGNSSNGCTP